MLPIAFVLISPRDDGIEQCLGIHLGPAKLLNELISLKVLEISPSSQT